MKEESIGSTNKDNVTLTQSVDLEQKQEDEDFDADLSKEASEEDSMAFTK